MNKAEFIIYCYKISLPVYSILILNLFYFCLTGGNRGVQRYRNRKQATTANSENRFSTQPVTLDEVQEAVLANQRAVVESADSENVSTGEVLQDLARSFSF